MSGQHVTTSKRLIVNTLSNLMTRFVCSVIGFCMVPFFVRTLGTQQYGTWILIASVFAHRNALNVGLNSAVNRYISIFLAKNDDSGIQRVVSTATLYLCFTSIILAAITLVVHRYVEVWFSIPPNMVGVTRTLVLIVGFSFVVIMPFQIRSAVLSGLQRYELVSIGTVVPIITRTAALILLLGRGYGLLTMGLAFGACEVAIRVLQVVFAKKLLPHISISLGGVDSSLLWQMLHYGANTMLYTLGSAIVYKSSSIIIGIYLTTTDITKYYVASAGIVWLGIFVQGFAAAIKPAISDLDTRGRQVEIRRIAFLTQKYVLILLMPPVFFFLVMGRDFLTVWAGADFGKLHLILVLLSVGHFLRLIQYSNFLVLVGRGQHRIFGVLAAAMALCTIALAIVFVGRFDLGLVGVALSNLLPMSLISGMILPVYFNHKMGIAFTEHLRQVWRPALAGSSPALLFIGLWKYHHSPDCWLHIGIVAACAFLVTLVGAWLWGLSPAEKDRFRRIIARGETKGLEDSGMLDENSREL